MTERVAVCGLSHHTSELEVRERLAAALSPDHAPQVRDEVMADELVVLSTCNRVELYLGSSHVEQSIHRVRRLLHERAGLRMDERERSPVYDHVAEDAIAHLFLVASSLDSMVLGEPQILGQVKEAFLAADRLGAVGVTLKHCFHNAFAVAKRVRSETRIGEGSVSVSSVALDLAHKIFGGLRGRKLLLLGAGEMAEATMLAAAKHQPLVTVVNRNLERAMSLAARFEGRAAGMEKLVTEMVEADVVVVSTASDDFLVTADTMRTVVRGRRRRPLFVVDISVPRNVDPGVRALENVFLYDVGDLEGIARGNAAARAEEGKRAQDLVSVEVDRFVTRVHSLDVGPTVVAVRNKVRAIVQNELNHTLERLPDLDPAHRDLLERMGDRLVSKVLHEPSMAVKARHGEWMSVAEAARAIFAVEEEHERRRERLSSPLFLTPERKK